MRTVGWFSAAVRKIWDFLVGRTALRGMSLVKIPPVVSIPTVKGQTSTSRRLSTPSSPERMAP